MKKTILIFVLLTLAIAFLGLLGTMPFEQLSFIEFTPKLHVIIETLISILLLSVAIRSEILYSQTQDKRFLILGYGFLVGMIFNVVHIFTIQTFPYDHLSLASIEKNPTSVYLFIGNIIIPLVIYYSLIFKSALIPDENTFRLKVLKNYFYIFMILALFPLVIYYLFPNLLHQFYIVVHTLEYVNYALFLMLSSILINAKFNSNQPPLSKFTLGLLVLGLGGIFYINPMLLPIKAILAHVFQALGLLLILWGIYELEDLEDLLKNKDKLAASLCIILVCFYVVFVSMISALSKVIFPQYSGYIFIEALLLFQLVVHIFSTASWNKVAKVYISSEHDQALLRVYDSMRRISNPHIIKNTIISEINKAYKPDKCFIVIYNPENNSFKYDDYYECLPSKTLSIIDGLEKEKNEFEAFQKVFNKIEIFCPNIDTYIKNYSLSGTPIEKLLRAMDIKSIYSVPIKYDGKLLGYIILQYKNEYKNLKIDDLAFLEKMAKQIGIVINNQN
jgi:hypothetical protein